MYSENQFYFVNIVYIFILLIYCKHREDQNWNECLYLKSLCENQGSIPVTSVSKKGNARLTVGHQEVHLDAAGH